MTEERAIYIGPDEALNGEACAIEARSDGVYARFDAVRTGMNIDWHGPFDKSYFDAREAQANGSAAVAPPATA